MYGLLTNMLNKKGILNFSREHNEALYVKRFKAVSD